MTVTDPTPTTTPASERRGLAEQIFVVSAAMVGVSLTLMGLIAITASLRSVATVAEEILAADAIFFLVACLSSYLALRTRDAARAVRYERLADVMFVIGLVAMVGLGTLVALELL